MARPSNGMFEEWLKEENLKKLTEWSKMGLIDKQIAHNMGISIATYYLYKKKYPEIEEAIKEGKEVVDMEVENALLKRALGYTAIIKEDKLDKEGCIHTLEREVHYPGDTTAQIFWLKNRRPSEWRERVQVDGNAEEFNKLNELLSKIEEGAKNE